MKQSNILSRQRALLALVQTEGVEAAYAAALEVCKDPKAPAPAKATCATTLFRVGGMLDARERGDAKDPSTMTLAEIEAKIAELRGVDVISTNEPNDGSDVFG